MSRLLERYLNGEYEQVWAHLTALGPEVRDPKYLPDAQAVARETSVRARSNVETLIRRLETLGYQFHSARRENSQMMDRMAQAMDLMNAVGAQYENNTSPALRKIREHSQAMMNHPALQQLIDKAIQPHAQVPHLEDSSILSPPAKNVSKKIADYEDFLGGPLPLSYRAWCENVGSVSLKGVHPALSFRDGEGRLSTYISAEMLRFAPPGMKGAVNRAGWDLVTGPDELMNRIREQKSLPLADPLVIFSFEKVWDEEPIEEDDDETNRLPIAPDDHCKANMQSEDSYSIEVPDPGADCPFLDWHETTFVNYLRIAFRWGGFPGWERYEDRPHKELVYLAEGLLPI